MTHSSRWVRQHCAYCDRKMGWVDLSGNIQCPVLCDKCFSKDTKIVCFICGTAHDHKTDKKDDDTYDVYPPLLPDFGGDRP